MRVIKKSCMKKEKQQKPISSSFSRRGKQGVRYTAMMPDARFARRLRGEKQ